MGILFTDYDECLLFFFQIVISMKEGDDHGACALAAYAEPSGAVIQADGNAFGSCPGDGVIEISVTCNIGEILMCSYCRLARSSVKECYALLSCAWLADTESACTVI